MSADLFPHLRQIVTRDDFPPSPLADFHEHMEARTAQLMADVEAERQDAIRRPPSNYRCDDPGCGLADPSACGKCRPVLRLVKEGDHA